MAIPKWTLITDKILGIIILIRTKTIKCVITAIPMTRGIPTTVDTMDVGITQTAAGYSLPGMSTEDHIQTVGIRVLNRTGDQIQTHIVDIMNHMTVIQ